MSLSVGLVGLPNAGKSTLFNALLKRAIAKVAEYPFTTVTPHEGVIDVPDERLASLALALKPEKVTPATIKFIDIAGLIKGAHKGEGLGNEFLGHIREVDLVLHLIRAFDSGVPHPMGEIDPKRDYEVVETELVLKDLETVKKLTVNISQPMEKKLESLIGKLSLWLNEGKPLRDLLLSPEEKEEVKQFFLLTDKPEICVLNISEKDLNNTAQVSATAPFCVNPIVICAKLEAELADFGESEGKAYLATYQINESGLEKLIKESYKTLDLLTFYTIKGGKEVRAWSIKKGATALSAAAIVHTDMAKGFIKAEVINYEDFKKYSSWKAASEAGTIELVGRDYQVAEGDILEIKFSP